MIPQPQRGPDYRWTGRHLYEVWPGGRRVYVGSVTRDVFRKAWSAWRRGEHLGSFSGEEGAREAMEEFAREQVKPKS